MNAIDDKFDRLFEEIHSLRDEMRAGFADLRTEIGGVRAEVGGVRAELIAFHRQITVILGACLVAVIGLLGVALG